MMKITDNFKARLCILLDNCEAFTDRSAEIRNLMCCIDDTRDSLRTAIELHRRITGLEQNPESSGRHSFLDELKICAELDEEEDIII